MKKFVMILIIQFFIIVKSAFPYAGVTGSDFLNFYPSARAYALGESDFADTTSGFAIYYNPAAAQLLSSRFLSFQHTEWFAGIRYEYLSYFSPYTNIFGKKLKNFGLSYMLVYLSSNKTYINSDYYIKKIDIYPFIKAGKYYATFQQLFLTKGFTMYGLNLGVNAKLLFSRIDKYNSVSEVFDIGSIWNTAKLKDTIKKRNKWKMMLIPDKISATIRNIGSKTYFISEKYADPLPTTAILGASYNFFNQKLFYTFNLRYRAYYGIIFGQGLEYTLFKILNLRLGYRHRFYDNNLKWDDDINFGLGLTLNIGEKSVLHLDYAMKSFGILGLTHYVSTYLKF